MEVRKPQVSSNQKKQAKASASSYLSDIKAEIKKINWTEKEELKAYTKIVIAATFTLGMGIYFSDLAIQAFLYGLGSIVKIVVG